MVLTEKVPLKKANAAKIFLTENNNFNKEYKVLVEKDHIYFPIIKRFKTKYKIMDKKLKRYEKRGTSLKEELIKFMKEEEIEKIKTAHDIVGDIAILEIDKDMRKYEYKIADALLKLRKDVKTVVRKKGAHEGEFRVQALKHLAGKKNKVTIHKENGIRLKLNLEKVYFSARLSSERKRIAELVEKSKKKEDVLVMFSGALVYPLVISKNSKVNQIVAIEKNPEGHEYALQNLKLNKINNIKPILGDVREVIPNIKKKFDRIVMPLPRCAEIFLDCILPICKKGTIIHLYAFSRIDEVDSIKKRIRLFFHKNKIKYRILRIVKCGQFSPKKYRICIDYKIIKI